MLASTILFSSRKIYSFFKKNNGHGITYFIFNYLFFFYLFLAALGLRCCVQAFSSCGERGLLFAAVRQLLSAVTSLVAEHGL